LTVAVLIFLLIVVLTQTAFLRLLLLICRLIPGLAAMLTLSLLTRSRLIRLTTLLIFVFGIVCHENLQAKHGSPRTLKIYPHSRISCCLAAQGWGKKTPSGLRSSWIRKT